MSPVTSSEIPAQILALFRPGEKIYLPGAAAEIPALSDAIFSNAAPQLDITGTFVPGINPFPKTGDQQKSRLSNPFGIGPRGAQAAGGVAQLPVSYGSFIAHLKRCDFDTCVVHVSPPDAAGRASLGPSVEFTPIVMVRARRVIAIVNSNIPHLPNAPSIALSDVDHVFEFDGPLREYDVGNATPVSDAIAKNIAVFIGDGTVLQVGLGKVPDALLGCLTDRRDLRIHSGMISDAIRQLVEAGALDPNWPSTSCVHVGTRAHYDWLAGRSDFYVQSCEHTHNPAVLAEFDRFVAVNGALSVDLFGQANLETLGGRAISGVGGAADFSRAASLSGNGMSIVGLPAASKDGEKSRITPSLDGLVSLPRHDIDVVVTEFGAADLRGLSVMERAEKIIAVAAPQHRRNLRSSWQDIAEKL